MHVCMSSQYQTSSRVDLLVTQKIIVMSIYMNLMMLAICYYSQSVIVIAMGRIMLVCDMFKFRNLYTYYSIKIDKQHCNFWQFSLNPVGNLYLFVVSKWYDIDAVFYQWNFNWIESNTQRHFQLATLSHLLIEFGRV